MRLRSLMVIAAALVLSGCDVPGFPIAGRPEEANSSFASDIILLEMVSAHEIRIGEKVATPETLPSELKASLGDRRPGEVRVLIRSNPAIPYEDFMAVLNIVHNAGITRVGIIK